MDCSLTRTKKHNNAFLLAGHSVRAFGLFCSVFVALRLEYARFSSFEICAPKDSCKIVLKSSLSHFLGIPLSQIGLVLSLVALSMCFIDIGRRAILRGLCFFMSSATLILQCYSLMILHAFCPHCFVYCICWLLAAAGSVLEVRYPIETRSSSSVVKLAIVTATFVCLLVGFTNPISRKVTGISKPAVLKFVDPSISVYPKVVIGNGEKVRIVAFVSAECGYCREQIPPVIDAVSDAQSVARLQLRWMAVSEEQVMVSAISLYSQVNYPGSQTLDKVFDPLSDQDLSFELCKSLFALAEKDVALVRIRKSIWRDSILEDQNLIRSLGVQGTPMMLMSISGGPFKPCHISECMVALKAFAGKG